MMLRSVLVGTLLSVGVGAQGSSAPAEPRRPVPAILEAFRAFPIVASADAHRHEQLHRLNLSLINDPEFPKVVNDIVVEFGNALHQSVIDRFTNGEDVPYAELRRVWMDTTQAHPVNDTPHAEEFFRTVRTINKPLPPARRLRVLLGDPPIDWSTIRTSEEHRTWISMRETFPADLIRREVIAKGRRALVLYGVMHLQRRNAMANFDSTGPAASLVSLLEDSGSIKVFTVGLTFDPAILQADAGKWPAPSLALLRGTSMGAANLPYEGPRFAIRAGKPVPIGRSEWKTMRVEDQFDALLYIGPRAAITDVLVAPELCADAEYVAMRTGRMALVGFKEPIDDYCGNVAPR
jgi:hypothetical protein